MDVHSGDLDENERSAANDELSEEAQETERMVEAEESLLPDAGMVGEDLPAESLGAEISDQGMEAVQPVFEEGQFPDLGVAEFPQPVEKPEKKKLIKFFISENQMKDLWRRASVAKEGVDAHINNPSSASLLLDRIKSARNELMAGEENYEVAERHINEVEYRIAFIQRVTRWSASLGIGLFVYETVWGIVLLLFMFLVLGAAAFISTAEPGAGSLSQEVVFLLGSMTWGGLGGVIGAWLSLIKHITRDQDFDRQHTLWYINSPVMGIGVGAVIYLILRAGLLSLSGPTQEINSPLIIYLLAWLAGYQQNVFTSLVKRMLKVFEIEEDRGESAARQPPPPEPASEETPPGIREQ
jgi:hypothetical protein